MLEDYFGYSCLFVMNVTDVDDKIILRARRNHLLASYTVRDPQVNFEHAARQAYIGLGFALVAAAFEEVDATPMEGFNPKALDELLNLSARGLRSVAIMPLGYREADKDWLVNLKKVRTPREQFVTEVK